MKLDNVKTILTGIKPTHLPHWGNYLGAIRPGIELASQAPVSILFIADYHALTSVHDAATLKQYTYSVAATWIACGLDPKKSIIYRQSDVPEIFELSWVLSCFAPKGLLNRAHAYKAKVQENETQQKEDLDFGVSMGLFTYPVLMAADILTFNADLVPVGEDQVQHVEIARDIAQKFNRTYGDILKIPRHIVKNEKLVPGLDGRKMSKSYNNHIPLFLNSKELRKLVMKIVTDSQPPEVPKDPKQSTVFDLFKEFAAPSQIEELTAHYARGIGWGEAKQKLFDVVDQTFQPHTARYNELMSHQGELDQILADGAERAREIAKPLLARVRAAIRG